MQQECYIYFQKIVSILVFNIITCTGLGWTVHGLSCDYASVYLFKTPTTEEFTSLNASSLFWNAFPLFSTQKGEIL